MHLFTGNVSLPRAAYLAVGGFDLTLRRSEDVELGIRLEKAGLTFEFCDEASTVHSSDHASQARWLETALIYGIYDSRIARKHQERAVSPWRRLLEANLLAKPFLLLSVVTPHTAGYVVRAAVAVVNRIDRAGHQRLAVTGLTVAFTMQYFRGVRREAGSLRHVITDLRRYVLA